MAPNNKVRLAELGEAVKVDRSEFDLSAVVDAVLDEFGAQLSLAEQAAVFENEAHDHMAKAKEINEGALKEARELMVVAHQDYVFAKGVLTAKRESIKDALYGDSEVVNAFKRLTGTPALEPFKVKMRDTLKAVQDRECADELAAVNDAVVAAKAQSKSVADLEAKANEHGDRGRELFAKAAELLKEIQ